MAATDCVAPSAETIADGSLPDLPVALHLRERGRSRGQPEAVAVRRLLPVATRASASVGRGRATSTLPDDQHRGRPGRLGDPRASDHDGRRPTARRPARRVVLVLRPQTSDGAKVAGRMARRRRAPHELADRDLRGRPAPGPHASGSSSGSSPPPPPSRILDQRRHHLVARQGDRGLRHPGRLEPVSAPTAGSRARASSTSARIFVGTVGVTVIAMIVAVPSAWVPRSTCPSTPSPRVRRLLKPILEVLAASRAWSWASSPFR